MPPKSDISDVIARLQKLEQDIGDLDKLEETIKRAKADLESINQATTQARAQMQEAQAGLTQVQREAQRRFDLDMFNKQGALRSLTERLSGLEEKVKELNEEVSVKGRQLQGINDSLNDARRRLTG